MSYLITDLNQLTPRHLTEILRKNGALERGDVTRITYTLHPRTTDVNVDGYILAHLSITYSSTPAEELTEFFNYRTIGGYEMPDNTAIFCIFPIPIRRRELQRQNPQRGVNVLAMAAQLGADVSRTHSSNTSNTV